MRFCPGPTHLSADLDHLTTTELVVQRPASHSIARFEHDHRVSGLDQIAGGAEPGEAGADNHHVHAARDAPP